MKHNMLVVLVIALLYLSTITTSAQLQGQNQEKVAASVLNAMYHVQVAAEEYAKDHKGQFPATLSKEFQCYFAGGSMQSKNPVPGNKPTNPVTGNEEWPIIGSMKSIAEAEKSINSKRSPGSVEYNPIKGKTGIVTDYVIRGFDFDGVPISKNGKVLIRQH